MAPFWLLALVFIPSRNSNAQDSSGIVPLSIACPACGAWTIDQPMLATAEGAIDLFVLSTIVSAEIDSRGSAESHGMAGPFIEAGLSVLVLNRLWAVPVNAWLASRPRGEPEWTSHARHRLEGGLELVQASDNNGWIGLRGGIGDFRLGVGMALAGMDGGSVVSSGDTTKQTIRSTSQFIVQADRGWSPHPRLRLLPGLKFAFARSTESVILTFRDAADSRGFRSVDGNAGPDRTEVAVVPQASVEITQWSWLAVTAHLGISAWSSGAPLGKAGTWDAGLGLSARAFAF